jgi:hypothetical protein
MPKKLSILVSLSLVVCLTARASFTGSWVGQGKAFDSRGWKADCTEISSEVSQTDKALIVKGGQLTCGSVHSQLSSGELTIQAGDLLLHGKKIGEISPTHLRATVSNSPVTQIYTAQVDKQDRLTYEGKIVDGDHTFTFKGTLHRQSTAP